MYVRESVKNDLLIGGSGRKCNLVRFFFCVFQMGSFAVRSFSFLITPGRWLAGSSSDGYVVNFFVNDGVDSCVNDISARCRVIPPKTSLRLPIIVRSIHSATLEKRSQKWSPLGPHYVPHIDPTLVPTLVPSWSPLCSSFLPVPTWSPLCPDLLKHSI